MKHARLAGTLAVATLLTAYGCPSGVSRALRGAMLDLAGPVARRLRTLRMGVAGPGEARDDEPSAHEALAWAYEQAMARLAQKEYEVSILHEQLLGISALAARPEFGARPLLPARIALRDPGTWPRVVWLDRGAADGVRPGMVAARGYQLVGRIDEVHERRSRVRLPTDPAFRAMCVVVSVAAQTTVLGASTLPQQDVALHGIVRGTGRARGRCEVDLIPVDQPVAPGDRILTTGDDNLFPPGLEIGRVTEVTPAALHHELDLVPSAPVHRLESVQILDWTPSAREGGP